MKVLNLIVKQEYFDAIISGEKKQEFREVKPTTVKKLIQLDEEGYEREDEEGNAIPVEYDAIRFYVGYNKNRDMALVEVKGVHSEIFNEVITFNGEPVKFVARDGEAIFYKTDEDGKFLKDEHGDFVETSQEDGSPLPCLEEEEEDGVYLERPITYDYDGRLWVAEQVVYDLGEILEKKVKPRFELRCHECDGSDYHFDYYDTREEAEAYIEARNKKNPEDCLYEHLYVVEVKSSTN